MRKIGFTSLLLATLLGAALTTGCKSASTVAGAGQDAARKVKTSKVKSPNRSIVILYDNDVHCGVDGYSKIAGLRDAISDTAYVAVVSSGDYIQGGTVGALSKGQYIIDIMKAVGYDAVTLGNHEFDYKISYMFDLLGQMKTPVTCVNLVEAKTNKMVYEPYVMKQMGDKKVAFVGVVTPTTLMTEAFAFHDEDGNQAYDLMTSQVYSIVQQNVDKARKDGADYVVVLSHLGEAKTDVNVDSHGLVENTTGIDVVLDGHTHSTIPCTVVNNKLGKPVLTTQTGTKFANVGKLLIMPDGKMTTELIPAQNIERKSASVQQTIDSIYALSEAKTSRHICDSDVPLNILNEQGRQEVRINETNAGDIVADAFRIVSGADLAMTNGGGIRCGLKPGKLTYGDLVAMLPYDNYLCVVEIPGSKIVEVLKSVSKHLPAEYGQFAQVSGLKYTVKVSDHSVTDVVVLNPQTNEYEPIDLNKMYKVATVDYCVTGGGFDDVLKGSKFVKEAYLIYSDALIQYVTENLKGHIGNEYAKPQGRITVVQ